MAFEHACFVSYRRHEQSELARAFIAGLCAALRNELLVMGDEDLFLDSEHMQSGQFLAPSLAWALCKSVCMIVVYTPTYFSRSNLYCAREYRAMEHLERSRLTLLTGNQRNGGFIIPVVLRGADCLPQAIRDERIHYNFERYSLAGRSLPRNPKFEEDIRQIVRTVVKRRDAIRPFADQLTSECQAFTLPTEDDVRSWLDSMVPEAIPFPLRTGGT